MITGIVAVMLSLAGLLLWNAAKRPLIHKNVKQVNLHCFLSVLLKRGYDRGFLVIRIPGHKEFIQFAKYIKGQGRVGLRCDFPNAEWSRPYCECLKIELLRADILYDISTQSEGQIREFITIDLQRDIKKADELASLILLSVFQLSPDKTVEISFSNVSPRDESIGF